ncbi:hypothetical protein Cpar_0942 [Chlorobaculum parvum NCIB 8327]|uniref:Uncharacterized protein n=1 Tax=Chlorobaculum parvum (strain DSM 263 / NCIMB 8327) TaxID=517417 RepID=B3QN49_CHLP8|nr:hypothetical protein Cpar_0942 [Chlorobaculum parvum NCIB 8327]
MLWRFKETIWVQDELKKRFTIQSIFGKNCDPVQVAPIELLVGAKLHPDNGLDCARQKYPPEFQYCPFCQAKLISLEEEPCNLWLPPYGDGTGLKIMQGPDVSHHPHTIKDVCISKDHQAKLFPLPGRDGIFAFCSLKLGAKQRMLLALQRDLGLLWVYRNHEEKRWSRIPASVGKDSLPGWSWSMATDKAESGLCLPTDDGPLWVTFDWPSNSIQVSRNVGRSIGGPIRIAEYIFAPVEKDGCFAMAYKKEGESEWLDCPSVSDRVEVMTQLTQRADQQAYLGIPYLHAAKKTAYWSCRGGYVSVIVDEFSSSVQWKFRAWETDEYPATALIELGPPYRTNGLKGGFWQLCKDKDKEVRDGEIYKIIKIDGDEVVDSQKIEFGEFVTTGRSSFSWVDDYWNDINGLNTNTRPQEELRYPLLQFGENGMVLLAKVDQWAGRDALGAFSEHFYKTDLPVSTRVRLVLEGAGVPERPLFAEELSGSVKTEKGSSFRISLAHLPEIRAFIYNKMLYVHFPENNHCFSWPIEITEK